MRGAVEVDHQLINLDLITVMLKDDEPDDSWYRIHVVFSGGGSTWLDFNNKEERDKFYNDFLNANT